MVGAVIVCDGAIIGEGYTSAFGGPHAEVNALNSVSDKGLLKRATLYVSLEPCCHQGKTPPCTNVIIASGIPRVVVGIRDPNPKVAGMGITQLQEAGIEVIEGILQGECRQHHRRFLTAQEQGRPYIILKWAESRDGFIAPENEARDKDAKPFWISGSLSRRLVHKWRTEEMAILVGTQTAVADNPALSARAWEGRNPYRLLIDRNLRVPAASKLLDHSTPTAVFHEQANPPEAKENLSYVALNSGKAIPKQIASWAQKQGLNSIIVEGGAQTLNLFISTDLWDEARIFQGPSLLKNGIKAPEIKGRLIAETHLEHDRLQILRND